jgi:hypothetical protein
VDIIFIELECRTAEIAGIKAALGFSRLSFLRLSFLTIQFAGKHAWKAFQGCPSARFLRIKRLTS